MSHGKHREARKRKFSDTAALTEGRNPKASDALYGNTRVSKEVSVRQIDNGFIRSTHEYGNEGHKSTETYHKSHPGLTLSERPDAPKGNCMKDATKYLKSGRGL